MAQEPDTGEWSRPLRAGMAVFVFLLVLAVFPYSVDPTGDIKSLVCTYAALLLALGWLTLTWLRKQPVRRPQLFLEILLLFLFLGLVSSLRSSYAGNSLAELRKFWVLFVLYLVATQIYSTSGQIRRLMLVVCAAVALSSLYGMFGQRLGHDPFPWRDLGSDTYTNLPGTFGNPNYAAHTLILATVMALYLATRRSMVWCLGFAVLFLVHLRFTQQRAGIIALAAAATLVLAAFFIGRRMRRPVAAAASTLFLVGVGGAVVFFAVMGASKLRTGTVYPLDLSLLVRYKSYCSAARMILTRPMLGCGVGNYKIEYPRFWTPYEQKWFADELKMNAHVHNDLLEIAADAGLPAAGLYLAFLVLGMGYGLLMAFTAEEAGRRRLGFTFGAFFCAFLIDGLFGFNLYVPVSATLLFVMAGALEGVWSSMTAPAPARTPTVARIAAGGLWRLGLCGVTIVCVFFESRIFLSQAYLQRGEAELHWQRFDRAESMFRSGERLAPWNWNFARQCGIACLGARRYADAAVHLERALTQNPQYVMTLVPLAQATLSVTVEASAGQPAAGAAAIQGLDAAAAYAESALRLCPMFPGAEEVLGRVATARALLLGKTPNTPGQSDKIQEAWREAETHFTRAIRYGTKTPGEVYRQLAQTRMALEDLPGAEEALVRSVQANPADEETWPLFYRLATDTKRYDRFRDALQWRIQQLRERGEAEAPNLAMAYLWLGSIEQDHYNALDAAETAFRNAVSTTPLYPPVWSAYARFAEGTHRAETFKKFLLEMAAQLAAAGKEPLPHVAALARVWSQGPSVLRDVSTALLGVVQGGRSVANIRPADLDLRWAVSLLVEELKKGPVPGADAAITLLHLGLACTGTREYEMATRLFPVALPKLPPELQAVCAQHWADALIHLDRYAEAINLLRDVIVRLPDNTDVKLTLARCLLRAGNADEARKEYQGLIDSPALDAGNRERIRAEFEALPKQ